MSAFLSYAEAALRMIAENGSTIVVTRHNKTGFDPVTQTSTAAPQTESFAAVVFPPGKEASLRINTLEHQRAQEIYFAALDKAFQPEPMDTFTWGGKTYAIFWAKTYNPDGQQPIITIAYAE